MSFSINVFATWSTHTPYGHMSCNSMQCNIMLYYVTLCYVFFCYVVYACEFRIEHPDFCDAFIVASRFSTLPTGRPGVGRKHVSRGSAVETGTTLSLFDIQFFPVICNCLYFVHIEI